MTGPSHIPRVFLELHGVLPRTGNAGQALGVYGQLSCSRSCKPNPLGLDTGAILMALGLLVRLLPDRTHLIMSQPCLVFFTGYLAIFYPSCPLVRDKTLQDQGLRGGSRELHRVDPPIYGKLLMLTKRYQGAFVFYQRQDTVRSQIE